MPRPLLAILTLLPCLAAAPTLYRDGDRLRVLEDGLLDHYGRTDTTAPRLAWEGGASAHSLRSGIDGSLTLAWHLDIGGTPSWWDVDLLQRPDGSVRVTEGPPGRGSVTGEYPTFAALADDRAARVLLAVLLPRLTKTPTLVAAPVLPVAWRLSPTDDVRWVAARVARLDAEDFRVRDRATRELLDDPAARPALVVVLATGDLSPEQRARVRYVVGGE